MQKVLLFLGAIVVALVSIWPSAFNISPLFSSDSICPIPNYVEVNNHEQTQRILRDEEFRNLAIERFAGGLRIDTTVSDDSNDESFTKFQVFHDYLQKHYPRVHETAEVTHINKWSLVFEFKGSDPTLKPVLFMAHQDTVPFGDLSTWDLDPLSGHIDYEAGKVYGRGSNDVKNLLMGLLGAMEEIIIQNNGDLDLKRGVILAFGHDEEISGNFGAHYIGEYILQKYGPKSIDHIIDEGAPMFLTLGQMNLGLIITAEKGYFDIEIEVSTPGGHSSNPKDRTSIGILSEIVTSYEKEPYEALLIDENPFLATIECIGEHSSTLPSYLRYLTKLARNNSFANYVVKKFIGTKAMLKYLIQTSQAVDIIQGGDKINALARTASAFINHRLALGHDSTTILQKAKKHALKVAQSLDLGLQVIDDVVLPATPKGNVVISSFGKYTRTAPITPLYDEAWNKLASHMKTFYEKEVYPEKFNKDTPEKYIIAPSSMQGNTDTRHYWDVTDHIYRVQPGITNLFAANMHGNNEWVHVDTHLQVIGFYYNYISDLCK